MLVRRIQALDLEFRRSFVLPVEEKFRTMITVVAGDISSHCWPGASSGGSTLAMMSIGRSWSGSLSVMFPVHPVSPIRSVAARIGADTEEVDRAARARDAVVESRVDPDIAIVGVGIVTTDLQVERDRQDEGANSIAVLDERREPTTGQPAQIAETLDAIEVVRAVRRDEIAGRFQGIAKVRPRPAGDHVVSVLFVPQ